MRGMNAAEIIEALGDTAEVSAATGMSVQAVSNWKLRGIPPGRWLDIHQLAQRLGRADISAEVIKAAPGRGPRQTQEATHQQPEAA